MMLDDQLISVLNEKIASMAELKARFAVNQSTLSRAIQRLEARRVVVQFGKARATRYARIRSSAILPEPVLPLYAVDEQGESQHLGSITAVAPQGYVVELSDSSPLLQAGYFAGMPFYLQALRPEGFLGRLMAKAAAEQVPGLVQDLQLWSDDAVLRFASVMGDDLPGAMVIGERAITRFLESKPQPIAENDAAALENAARRVESGEAPGSSAGGERPKLTAYLQQEDGRAYHAIVKFSGTGDNPVEARWRDLLVAEHLALVTLNAAGLTASPSRLLCQPNGRVFLAVERYDRIAAKGRRHYFSLAAVDHALIGDFRHIRKSVTWLWQNRLLTREQSEQIILISLFGDFIGNTDQHFGNVSLGRGENQFVATPAYDVLPMWYAPGGNGVLPQGRHRVPAVLPEYKTFAASAHALARQFWAAVVEDSRVSREFRQIAADNHAALTTDVQH
jgi:hypothetical protein